MNIEVAAGKPADFELKLRLPWWMAGKPTLTINGKARKTTGKPSSFVSIRRKWGSKDLVRLELPRALTVCPLPGSDNLVAFMDGPLVLVGMVDEQRTLTGDRRDPRTMLRPDREREWDNWHRLWHTHGQDRNFLFMPIHDVVDDKYTMYFPVKKKKTADTAPVGICP